MYSRCFTVFFENKLIQKQISIDLQSNHKEDFIMRKSQFSQPLSVALPPDHYDQIKQITDDEQISMAQWVRQAVAKALNNIKREGEQMNEQ
jgi:tartrate dehydratase alpha subunit/fumarate hydratase class I-like protein